MEMNIAKLLILNKANVKYVMAPLMWAAMEP